MKTMTDSGRFNFARRGVAICLLLLIPLLAQPAHAQARLVVRDSLGLSGINLTCALLGCNVVRGLGDPQGQLFLVTFPSILNPVTALLKINLQLGIVDVEIDQVVNTQAAYAGPAPSYLTDEKPTSYYGETVWHGYVAQPANQVIRTSSNPIHISRHRVWSNGCGDRYRRGPHRILYCRICLCPGMTSLEMLTVARRNRTLALRRI